MAEHEQLHGDHVFQHPDHARLDEERLHNADDRRRVIPVEGKGELPLFRMGTGALAWRRRGWC